MACSTYLTVLCREDYIEGMMTNCSSRNDDASVAMKRTRGKERQHKPQQGRSGRAECSRYFFTKPLPWVKRDPNNTKCQ